VQLVACPGCRTHYDVTGSTRKSFSCPCGATVEIRLPRPVDALVQRCGSCGAPVDPGARSCAYCHVPLARDGELSLLCPECYARNLQDSRFCTSCGIVFRPQALPDGVRAVPCVRCGTPLAARPIGGVIVQECSRCHGIWVAGEGFDELVRRAVASREKAGDDPGEASAAPRRTGGNPVAERVEYRRCPECGSVMSRRNYRRTSGVIIDRCRDHGTWLDADELERIAGFILSGGLERAKAAEATTMKVAQERPLPGPDRTSASFQRLLVEHRPVRGTGPVLLDTVVNFLSRLIG